MSDEWGPGAASRRRQLTQMLEVKQRRWPPRCRERWCVRAARAPTLPSSRELLRRAHPADGAGGVSDSACIVLSLSRQAYGCTLKTWKTVLEHPHPSASGEVLSPDFSGEAAIPEICPVRASQPARGSTDGTSVSAVGNLLLPAAISAAARRAIRQEGPETAAAPAALGFLTADSLLRARRPGQ